MAQRLPSQANFLFLQGFYAGNKRVISACCVVWLAGLFFPFLMENEKASHQSSWSFKCSVISLVRHCRHEIFVAFHTSQPLRKKQQEANLWSLIPTLFPKWGQILAPMKSRNGLILKGKVMKCHLLVGTHLSEGANIFFFGLRFSVRADTPTNYSC